MSFQHRSIFSGVSNDPKHGDCPMLPTAYSSGQWELWLASMLYFVIGALALIGFIHALRANRPYYFRISFLAASFLLCLLRGVQTLVYIRDIERHMFVTFLIDLFLPIYLQFWQYSLLILFVWRCILIIQNHEDWVHRYLYPIYHVTQFVLLTLCFTTAYELSRQWKSSDLHDWDRQPALYVAFLYFTLVCFGVVFACRAYRLLEMAAISTSLHNRSKLKYIRMLMGMFLLLFFLRSVWNILHFVRRNPLQNWINDRYSECDQSALAWAYLVFYGLFEILPTAVVVYIVTLYIKPQSTTHSPLQTKNASYHSTDVIGTVESNSSGGNYSDGFVDVPFASVSN